MQYCYCLFGDGDDTETGGAESSSDNLAFQHHPHLNYQVRNERRPLRCRHLSNAKSYFGVVAAFSAEAVLRCG
jgi:hypothetical protein